MTTGAVGSEIIVTYDGDDITSHVLWSESRFEAQMAAVPGTFQVTCKDMLQELNFSTGRELTLDIDGQRLFGGYVLQVAKTNFFPAADTTGDVTEVNSRKWVLSGSDYNVLFDKRVLRNPARYTTQIPRITGTPTDVEVISDWFPLYFDIPAGFDFDTELTANHTFPRGYTWPTQGETMRKVLDDLAAYGSVYYIDGDKFFHWIPVQDTLAPWGLSDQPNWLAINDGGADPDQATIGFRDGEMIEDATGIANDALVWGGSQWADNGDVVFARRQNATSIEDHSRWQIAEVHVGEENYHGQGEVTARANTIVDGNASGVFAEGSKGLVNPAKQFRGTWFGHDVPTPNEGDGPGARVHLRPGQVIRIRMRVFGGDFSLVVPLRQIQITFPTLDKDGNAFVKFEGFFGVQMSDPHWLWAYLQSLRKTGPSILLTANNTSVNGTYSALYQDVPSPAPNGGTTVFTIPFPYVGLSTQVFRNGQIQRRDAEYTESDPTLGQITFASAPGGGDALWVVCFLAG